MLDMKKIPCFGVAGNFTGHLEQAGEAKDFVNVKAEVGAPKALFPTYIPLENTDEETVVPDYLKIFPFDAEKIIFPQNEQKLQIEPECAIICDVAWEKDKIVKVVPKFFGASNDCSIRKEGAKKISMKKNWGPSSKGISENLIDIDSFTKDGILNNYKIASFLVRDRMAFPYGEDSFVKDYSYIYEKLISWVIEKLNNQKDEGPAEEISKYLQSANFPKQIMISIGATRYTEYGESHFLQKNDESVVVVYPYEKYSFEQIKQFVENHDFSALDVSYLCQKIF